MLGFFLGVVFTVVVAVLWPTPFERLVFNVRKLWADIVNKNDQ